MSEIANTLFPPPPDYYKHDDLQPPRADWVAEEGRWLCFGEEHQINPHIPTCADISLPPFVADTKPAQETMPVLLNSFLHTMLLLIQALTKTARDPMEMQAAGLSHETDQIIQHLTNLAATMMVMSNQLRTVQAEATLVMLMEKQLAERKAQTAALKEWVSRFGLVYAFV